MSCRQSHFYCNYSIGGDAYTDVAHVCLPYGNKVLLIGGKTALASAQKLLESAIEGTGLQLVDTQWYGGQCTQGNIERLAKLAGSLGVDMIFGMGGGKALDTAKAAASLAGIPVFTFPTIAATCAATTALSVVYHEDGSYDTLTRFTRPPYHAFINTDVIARAPWKWLQAGIGDTLAKFFECHFASRGDKVDFSNALGRQISNTCYTPLLESGAIALENCKKGISSVETEETVLSIIVSTGLVSTHVRGDYNTALGHAIYYGLCAYPGFEERELHGNVVAYGILVQLFVDGKLEEALELKRFLQTLGIASTLHELQLPTDNLSLEPYLKSISQMPDLDHVPYSITVDMIYDGMMRAEQLG